MNDRKFDNFDEFATDYRQIHTENIKISGADSDYFSEYRIIEIKRIEQTVLDTENEPIKVLDIGCGDGNAARFFKKYFPKSTIYGIDITEKVVAQAKERNLPDCNFQVFDGENIPFETNSFDFVFMTCVLHHVHKDYHLKLIKEALRILKPNGKMYNFEHNPWNPITQKVVNECPFDVDAVLLTAPYLKRMKLQAGFKSAKITFTIFFPRFSLFKPFLGLEKYMGWLPFGGQYYVRAIK